MTGWCEDTGPLALDTGDQTWSNRAAQVALMSVPSSFAWRVETLGARAWVIVDYKNANVQNYNEAFSLFTIKLAWIIPSRGEFKSL